MRKKGPILTYLNMRSLKSVVFSALCRIRPVGAFLNYYQEAESFEDAADDGSLRTLEIHPLKDYGISFTEDEKRVVLKSDDTDLASLTLTYKMARIRDVTILGSAGVSISNRSGKALYLDRNRARMHPNWVVARHLKTVAGDESATYINLLGVRKGHRHFAHFFWDMLVPVMVYLKNWHDPAENVIFLVREDLSAIQRDAFGFITEDFPGVAFRTLRANEKIGCARSIYIAYQNASHGKDNALARDALLDIRDMFFRHYGMLPPQARGERRIHVSRNDSKVRRTKNERAVMGVLTRHGFESRQMSKLPFRDQAALFHSADIVVATHGAGLANLMFCRPGTKVLEIFPSNFIDEGFLKVAKAARLDYDFFIAGEGDFRQDFEIDSAALESALISRLGI